LKGEKRHNTGLQKHCDVTEVLENITFLKVGGTCSSKLKSQNEKSVDDTWATISFEYCDENTRALMTAYVKDVD
jgi:hypothetical protein